MSENASDRGIRSNEISLTSTPPNRTPLPEASCVVDRPSRLRLSQERRSRCVSTRIFMTHHVINHHETSHSRSEPTTPTVVSGDLFIDPCSNPPWEVGLDRVRASPLIHIDSARVTRSIVVAVFHGIPFIVTTSPCHAREITTGITWPPFTTCTCQPPGPRPFPLNERTPGLSPPVLKQPSLVMEPAITPTTSNTSNDLDDSSTTHKMSIKGVVVLARNGDRLECYQDPKSYKYGPTESTPLGEVRVPSWTFCCAAPF